MTLPEQFKKFGIALTQQPTAKGTAYQLVERGGYNQAAGARDVPTSVAQYLISQGINPVKGGTGGLEGNRSKGNLTDINDLNRILQNYQQNFNIQEQTSKRNKQTKQFNDWLKSQSGTQGIVEIPQSLLTPSTSNLVVYNGVLTPRSAVANEEQWKAGVASGTMKNIGTKEAPMYVPTGSAGEKNWEQNIGKTAPVTHYMATYQGDKNHPTWQALGATREEIEQRARQAGINPANLQWKELRTPTTLNQPAEVQAVTATSPSGWKPPAGYEYITGPSQLSKYKNIITEPGTIRKWGIPITSTAEVGAAIPADQIEKTISINPRTDIDQYNGEEILNSTNSFLNHWLTEANQLEQQRQQMEAERSKYLELYQNNQPQLETKLAELQQKYQIPQNFEKINDLVSQISATKQAMVDAEARFNRGMEAIENKQIAMPLIVGKQAALKKQFNIEQAARAAKLGALTAEAAMYQGNIRTANSIIDRVAKAYTYDYEEKKRDYEHLFTYYGQYVNSLNSRIQNDIKNSYNELLRNEQIERNQIKEKLNIMLKAAGQGVDLGLSPDDIKTKSVEEIANLYNQEMAGAGKEWSEPYKLGGDYVQKNRITGEIRTAVNVPKGRSYSFKTQEANLTRSAWQEMRNAIVNDKKLGPDGFLSPDDYLIYRNQWIEAGLDPADFDKLAVGFRNPNNPYYVVVKQKKTTGGSAIDMWNSAPNQ